LTKFSPLSGVPAATLLLTSGAAFFCAAAAAAFAIAGSGDGVSGALKGCAADVEVAAGAASAGRAFVCVAVAAEMGVALLRGAVVERKRGVRTRGSEGRAARRQVRQIMAKAWGVVDGGRGAEMAGACLLDFGHKFRGNARGVFPVPDALGAWALATWDGMDGPAGRHCVGADCVRGRAGRRLLVAAGCCCVRSLLLHVHRVLAWRLWTCSQWGSGLHSPKPSSRG
jgi:hypothetical protein